MGTPTEAERDRLVERLRARKKRFQANHGNYLYYYGADAILDEHAAAEITRLRAENAGMREALKPFAEDAAQWDFSPECDEGHPIGWDSQLTVSDLRRARSALSNATTPETGGEA